MNAGPGPIQGDDDNDGNLRNRDWLDWIYMSLRGLMLLSIIYFYSSTSRFLMVLMLGTILYLYKSGWFTPQRVHIPPGEWKVKILVNVDNLDDKMFLILLWNGVFNLRMHASFCWVNCL